MQEGTYFPKVRRKLLFLAPLGLIHFWPASKLLREHLALATLSLRQILEFWGVGAALMRFTWANISERRILVSNFSVTRDSLRELYTLDLSSMSVLFRRIDFGGVMSWNTQPNCRASDNWRFDDLRPNFLSLLLSGLLDRSWYRSVTDPRSCQSSFFNIVTALLSLFDLDHFVGCVSTWRCANEHFSPRRQPFFFL